MVIQGTGVDMQRQNGQKLLERPLGLWDFPGRNRDALFVILFKYRLLFSFKIKNQITTTTFSDKSLVLQTLAIGAIKKSGSKQIWVIWQLSQSRLAIQSQKLK